MTELHGKNLIGGQWSSLGQKKIAPFDPKQGKAMGPLFYEATTGEVDQALALAAQAFPVLRESRAEIIAGFLESAADEITALGDSLIERASQESGLPKERLTGERGRTVNQLRLFAELVKNGSYLDVRIDTALPDRKPLPRPDLRRMLLPVGPVVVFGASNFPLAFSVAGGDTASALAARNPVVVKAHPAHPGTSELVALAITRAVQKSRLPEGTVSMIHAADPVISLALVKHPTTKAVAFTGSLHAGRAIFDAAAQRPEPIPAFVEMGSSNPVFVLPGALKNIDALAQGLFNSVTLGVGQFCTSPGLVIAQEEQNFRALRQKLAALFQQGAAGTMLHPGILKGYEEAVSLTAKIDGVAVTRSLQKTDSSKTEAAPTLFETDARTWLKNRSLANEIFGPSTIAVSCGTGQDLVRVAQQMHGSLTATIFGTPADLEQHRDLIGILETKAGRLIFNGFPTGVEVSPAMHHGGPYPATADAKFTSVGTAAILRFLRPVCYQNFPANALPLELRNENPKQIWRTVNGELTRDPIG